MLPGALTQVQGGPGATRRGHIHTLSDGAEVSGIPSRDSSSVVPIPSLWAHVTDAAPLLGLPFLRSPARLVRQEQPQPQGRRGVPGAGFSALSEHTLCAEHTFWDASFSLEWDRYVIPPSDTRSFRSSV